METMEKEAKKDPSHLSADEKKALNDTVQLRFDVVKDKLVAKWLKEGYSVVILLRRPPTGLLEITVNGRLIGSKPEEEFKSPCDLCGKFPCKVQRYMDCYCIFVKYYINDKYKDLPNNEKRKLIYRKLNEEVRGIRGKYNRKRFPRCVERLVRYQWPSSSGEYLGFKRVRDGNDEEEGTSDNDMEDWVPKPEEPEKIVGNEGETETEDKTE